jgi:hypothetical protein
VSERRHLNFADAQSVAIEVRNLRAGYRQTGSWSLPQVCWHLNQAMRYGMARYSGLPVSDDPAKQEIVERVLSSGRISAPVKAPERALPPADAPESIIDEFLERLGTLKDFPGPFAPHPVFGQVETEKAKRLVLIHCAHHLGFLIPTGGHG